MWKAAKPKLSFVFDFFSQRSFKRETQRKMILFERKADLEYGSLL
jgi:hypothetical protein